MTFHDVLRAGCGPVVESQFDRPQANRRGFSLLEVMLATAMLAASALVLSSLLGLGAKFGRRAEERTQALSLAQSLLDEFLAMPIVDGDPTEEQTGELPTTPPRSYRIRVEPVSKTSVAGNLSAASANLASPQPQSNRSLDFANADNTPSGSSDDVGSTLGSDSAAGRVIGESLQRPRQLMLITVEVFETTPGLGDDSQEPLCQLYRLARY